MRDVDDVEDAERDRNAEGHGGVEPAEQDAGDQGIDQQIEAETHLFPPVARFAPNTCFGGRAHFILVASVQEGRGLG